MSTEGGFTAIFWALLVFMLLMRSWFAFRVWRTGERLRADRAAHQREGLWAHVTAYVFFLLLAGVVLDFCFQGGNLRKFAFPAPGWLRWIGVGLGGNERGTICVDSCGPGAFLVPLPATALRPQVDYARSLRTNPASHLFCDRWLVGGPWPGGGQRDFFCLRGARRTQFPAADSRGRKDDAGTVR